MKVKGIGRKCAVHRDRTKYRRSDARKRAENETDKLRTPADVTKRGFSTPPCPKGNYPKGHS